MGKSNKQAFYLRKDIYRQKTQEKMFIFISGQSNASH